MKTMTKTDFTARIVAERSPEEVFDAIANVGNWWTESFKGSARNVGDTFSVTFGETSVDFKITESLTGTRVKWLVTNCYLHWLNNKNEWTGTSIAWEISPEGDTTTVVMTHIGLVPEIECFESCKKGWDFFIGESLFKLLSENKGQPDRPKVLRNE